MAYDHSRFDAVSAKIKARAAELNKTAKDGWDRLDNYMKASKEFHSEMEAAKTDLYKQSPGGTYKSYVATRNPFRTDNSEAKYLQAKHSGMSHEDIMRAGYSGKVPAATPFNTVGKYAIKSQYVKPEYRTEGEWKKLDPNAWYQKFGQYQEQYKQKLNQTVENGGGIPATGNPGDVAATTPTPASPAVTPTEPAVETTSPVSTDPVINDSSIASDAGDSEGLIGGSPAVAPATSDGFTAGDDDSGSVVSGGTGSSSAVEFIDGSAKAGNAIQAFDPAARAQAANRTRSYYNQRFS